MKNFISVLCLFIIVYVFTPQLTYAYEGIWFFDSNGKLTSFQETKNRVKSFAILNNGNFLIKSDNYLYEVPPGKEFNILKTYLIDHDLFLLGKFSDDTNLAFEKGKLYLLNNKNRKVKAFDKKDQVIFKAIKFDDDHIVIHKNQTNNLSMIDKTGNVVWEKPYGLRSISAVENDRILITKSDGKSIHELDGNGNLLSQHDLPFEIRTYYKLGNKYLFFPVKNENNLIITDSKFNIISVLHGLTSPQKFFIQLPNGFALVGQANDLKKMDFQKP